MRNITLLLDHYSESARLLKESLAESGFRFLAVSVEYDGYLPEDIGNPYAYYTGAEGKKGKARPLYFDRLQVPHLWEIRGTSAEGEVLEYEQRRARIFYAKPKNKRFVRIVDWLDEDKKVRFSDHYDRFGNRFAQTVLENGRKMILKTYFDAEGREKIIENFVTGSIMLQEGELTHVFDSRSDFVLHYLRAVKAPLERIFYNSLSTPFMVSEKLGGKGDDVLFWQESVKNAIPGNMKIILNGKSARTSRICVQSRLAYDKLTELGASGKICHALGFAYRLKKENGGGKDVLILTNSDQIVGLSEIAAKLPDMRFHVAALTEMSAKLLATSECGNVFPIPNVWPEKVAELYRKCDYYLDINHGSEILDAVHEALKNDLLILGFTDTLHNAADVAPGNLSQEGDVAGLIRRLKRASEDKAYRERLLSAQKKHAMFETKEAYHRLLGA